MNLLLDTHAFLWLVEGDTKLSTNARQLIEDTSSVSFLSIASVWEMAIKVSLGKLTLRQPLAEYISYYLAINGFTLLPVTIAHTSTIVSLPFHHRDPFDRLLVAQALVEDMSLVSRDAILDNYGVVRVR